MNDTESERGLPEPVAFRVRYKSEPGMIGNYPWSYLDGKRRKHYDQPKNECEDLYTAEQLRAAIEKDRAERSEAVPKFSCYLERDHGKAPCDHDCGKLRCMYPRNPPTAPPERSDVQGAEALTSEQRKDLLAAAFCVASVGDPSATMNAEAAERTIALLESLASRPAVQQEGMVPHGCHCDLEPGMSPDGCVLDEGRPQDCVYARRVKKKEECSYWRPIVIAAAPPAAACAKDDK